MDVRLVLTSMHITAPAPGGPLIADMSYHGIDPTTGYSVDGLGHVVEVALGPDRRTWKRALVDAVCADATTRGWAVKKIIWVGEPTFGAEKIK